MANMVITKLGESVVVDFGDYYNSHPRIDYSKGSYWISDIHEVRLYSDHILMEMKGQTDWLLTHNETSMTYFIVDSVEGVVPTNLNDLFDKITALRTCTPS